MPYDMTACGGGPSAQEAPPFHDGRRVRLEHDARWRAALGLCREAFDGTAAQILLTGAQA